ncbi:MAG: PIG-L family deacetylase [Actinobacteria bacterium]|nr:PIG-L family deacetylase [Actinomycetota bacterium]
MRLDAHGNPLCVLTVHAHPDDEASKGAPTLAAYADLGVRTVLVCCTGGEEGDLQNPALREPGGPFHGVDPADEKAVMARLRPVELSRSAEIIGFHEVVMLGYRDSGMVDSPTNQNPDCFHQAVLDEAVGRLVAVIRRTRPHVIITYNDDQRGYPHPDHVKVHDVSVVAFERAGDPTWYPWAGPAWQPLKMYYTVWTKTRMRMVHDAMIAKSGKSPFDEKWLSRPSHDDRVTTRLHIASHMHVRSQALLAHTTQVDPTEAWWFGLDDDELSALYPWEDWVLARSAVSSPEADAVEICLFDGIATVMALPVGVDRPQRLVELERTTTS